MSSLLELAAEFFDRMTNPAYGAEVNEEYALRLASLLDEETSARLNQEARQLKSSTVLSAHAWTWLLEWTKTAGVSLDFDLLVDLCERWESATFKAVVIEAATRGSAVRAPGASVPEFPHPWLRTVLVRATRPPSDQQQDRDPHVPIGPGSVRHSRHVHSLLIALLLVERDITLDAATALLHERWEGQ